MIKSFRSKGLEELWQEGETRRIAPGLQKRIRRRLTQLAIAKAPRDMNLPGFDFHALKGLPRRYTVHVNGPWCLTFEWEATHAIRVDLEQYH